jgi:hypothetical protein
VHAVHAPAHESGAVVSIRAGARLQRAPAIRTAIERQRRAQGAAPLVLVEAAHVHVIRAGV